MLSCMLSSGGEVRAGMFRESPMSTATRLAGALEALFAELDEVARWEGDLAAEARTAARRRERLAESIRATVDALEPQAREPWLVRLRALTAAFDPARPKRRPTARTRAALKWLKTREPAVFTTADLRAHFESKGLQTDRHYLPTLLYRYTAEGVVTRTGHGRFRVNREHPGNCSRGWQDGVHTVDVPA